MTDATVSQGDDSFWTRVRSALDVLRPVAQTRGPLYGRAEIDRTGGQGAELLLAEALDRAWTQAAGQRRSLSLLMVEIDRWAEYLTAYGSDGAEDCAATLEQIIKATLVETGASCLRHGQGGFAVVLPGFNKGQGKDLAIRIAQALRRQHMPHKDSHHGLVTAAMALATTRPDGGYEESLLQSALDTLQRAQRRGMGRMMAIDLKPEPGRRAA